MGDVRCPDRGRLFWRVRDDGLLEVSCRDCRIKQQDVRIAAVLHLYRSDGTWVRDETLRFVTHEPPTRRARAGA